MKKLLTLVLCLPLACFGIITTGPISQSGSGGSSGTSTNLVTGANLTNISVWPEATNQFALTVKSNGYFKLETTATNGYSQVNPSRDWTNWIFGVQQSPIGTVVGHGREVLAPAYWGIYGRDGSGIYHSPNAHSTNDGFIVLAGAPGVAMIEIAPVSSNAAPANFQIGVSGPGYGKVIFQYDDAPDASQIQGHSKVVGFQARTWDGSAVQYAMPGIVGRSATNATLAGAWAQGFLDFYSKTPEWNYPYAGFYETPDYIGNLIMRVGPSGITCVSNFITFNGNGGGLSNLNAATLFWNTNSAVPGASIDISKPYAGISTNNNLSFTGLSGVNVGNTNFDSAMLLITNTSAAEKTITMSAQFQNMNASEGNTLYLTNLGQLLVFRYPGLGGTNFYWKSR